MKRFLLFTAVVCSGLLVGRSASSQDRSLFVSDASFVVGTYEPAESDYLPATMVAKANVLLESLDEHARGKISFAINSRERREWTNLPAKPNAGGVRLGDMDEGQIKAALDLMASLLSQHLSLIRI